MNDIDRLSNLGPSRRQFLRSATLGMLGVSASRWLPALADDIANHPDRRRQCILLWMSGGPSQIDTFDMKPDHSNGGEFQEIATNVPGIRISEHLPKLAKQADQIAVVRGLSTKEGDHARGTHLMRTGKVPGGPVSYPCIGSSLSKALGNDEVALPNYISIGATPLISPASFGPGFLGPKYAATTVGAVTSYEGAAAASDPNGFAPLGVDHLTLPRGVSQAQAATRRALWTNLQDNFLLGRPAENARAQDTVYRRAMRMMDGEVATAFDLSQESDDVRAAYGRGRFGQGCLLARRLIERGVPFVEITLAGTENSMFGWDTHRDNFPSVRQLSERLDAGWGTLMQELRERGLLETTTILWMGEFGRTPTINTGAGRDHFPQAWTCVFGGGGIAAGQAFGKTSSDGTEVVDGKVSETDVLATLCAALGVDPSTENMTKINRPIQMVEGEPIKELLA